MSHSGDVDAALATLDAAVWQRLEQAAARHDTALRSAVLATSGAEGAEARTVVLRAADRGSRALLCYSDARAAKLLAIATDPRVTWLFYDAARREQLRLTAQADIHQGDALAQAHWQALPTLARGEYAAIAVPGMPLSADAPQRDLAAAAAHFAVIACRVQALDYLQLDRAGHRRAICRYGASGQLLTAAWVQA